MRALLAWANASPKGLRGGGGEAFRDIVFHHRPGQDAPEAQVRFIATMVDGRPMIRVELVPDEDAAPSVATAMTINLTDTWPAAPESPREATAACEACGTIGTVGWIAMREPDGSESRRHRFCADCWGPEAAWHRARFEDVQRQSRDEWLRSEGQGVRPPTGGLAMQSATWHGVLEQVDGE